MSRIEDLRALSEEVLAFFRGLMDGTIDYSFDNLNCALKTDICEVFDAIAGDFVINIECGNDDKVTNEQLQALHDNLIAFGEEYNVKEAATLAEKVKALIDS